MYALAALMAYVAPAHQQQHMHAKRSSALQLQQK
jgi:hypothetical protein